KQDSLRMGATSRMKLTGPAALGVNLSGGGGANDAGGPWAKARAGASAGSARASARPTAPQRTQKQKRLRRMRSRPPGRGRRVEAVSPRPSTQQAGGFSQPPPL